MERIWAGGKTELFRFGNGREQGYLVVAGGRHSLLIDCPTADIASRLRAAELPLPEVVLHTQVQEEHCREAVELPLVPVYTPSGCRSLARRHERYFQQCRPQWPPSRSIELLGYEKYSLAGCATERPPEKGLKVTDSLRPGEVFQWRNLHFEVIALPGHGKRSVGLLWREARALFAGDLVEQGGYLVNLYDLERAFTGEPAGYYSLLQSLDRLAGREFERIYPATGEVISDPAGDLARLRERVAWVFQPPRLVSSDPCSPFGVPYLRTCDRFGELLPGLWQNREGGSEIILISPSGEALVIDPGTGDWRETPVAVAAFHRGFDALEREAGLRRVTHAFLTHYHGTHLQFAPELKKRYGTVLAATGDVAERLEFPARFNLPCLVDWYDLNFARLAVDWKLIYGQTWIWQDLEMELLHTPGHTLAHAGLAFRWEDELVMLTGDALRHGKGPTAFGLPVCHSQVVWPDSGVVRTLELLSELRPTLVLGGHSHAFRDPAGRVVAELLAVAKQAQKLAAGMVKGELAEAMTPP